MKMSSKEKLIQASIKVFSHYGFDGASTRMIAKEAGVNISAIAYYFSGKEGLYEAVLKHIVGNVKGKIYEMVNEISSNGALTDDALKMQGFIRKVIHFMLGREVSPYMVNIFISELVNPSSCFKQICFEILENAHTKLTAVVAGLINVNSSDEKATLCTHAILGQVIGFRTHKMLVLKRLDWQDYGFEEIDKIADTVIKHTNAIIKSYQIVEA